jgi:hypothetical protein
MTLLPIVTPANTIAAAPKKTSSPMVVVVTYLLPVIEWCRVVCQDYGLRT